MPNRPPLPDRWEFQLLSGLLSLFVLARQLRPRRATDPDSVEDPALREWLADRDAEQTEVPWRARLAAERAVLRTLTTFWLAWRAYRFEQAERRGR